MLKEMGKQLIKLPTDFIERLIENEKSMLFYPRVPAVVSSFIEDQFAAAGLLLLTDY